MVAVTRTQGQHDVLFDEVAPYSAFPKRIDGPTVWKAEDLRAHPERWTRQWSDEQIQDLEDAYDAFKQRDLPLTAIDKVRMNPHVPITCL